MRQHSGKAARSERPVTITEVAHRAGVSTATVSRALNKPESVRAELRERIHATIRQLGYIPSGAARALVTRRTRAVGAVVPTLDNAIFASGISALQRRLGASGYTLLVAASEYDLDQEVEEVRTLLGHGIECLMLVGTAHRPALYELLERNAVAYVCCWMYAPDAPHPCIGFDNQAAARRLTEMLLALGHRDIAVIAGVTRDNDRAAGRLAGVRQAVTNHGLTLPAERVVEVPYEIGAGRQGWCTIQAVRTDWPTAVVCGNDILAIGVLLECNAQGISVPKTLSVVGFDDLPIAAHFQPPLTTVRIPAVEMGTRAGDYLLARISGESVADHVAVDTNLIFRETCGPPLSR